jgi:ABC-type polysaccharide/polyol phosphate export permease
MVGVLDGWRWAVLRGAPLGWQDLLSAGVGVLVLLVGLRVFQRGERRFADII